ncbi:MAG: hypothetical protein JXR96_12215 [Deltaproteobacteria bacterium]|nr:hypothetical protein [Deltaproteobacteria bacterium]
MKTWISKLEAEIRPQLASLAERIERAFPRVRVSVESHYSGPARWGLYLSCLFTDAGPDQVDQLDLGIELCERGAAPGLNADLCWGHPSGRVELCLTEDWASPRDWPAADEESIERLRAFLPALFRDLERLLAAGPVDVTSCRGP